jgi:hypothetical protein
MLARFAPAVLLLAGGLVNAEPAATDPLAQALPAGWRAEVVADIVAPHALKLTPPQPGQVSSLVLLAGAGRVSEAQLEGETEKWHQAHQRNRVAWGMRAAGGLPATQLRIGGKRALVYRDRVGSAVGRGEQTLTCLVHAGRLLCALAMAPPAARDEVDGLISTVLAAVQRRK